MNPYVSIIIPTYRDWNRLGMCLEALKKQSYPKENTEIIIINNDPEDLIPVDFKGNKNITIMNAARNGSYAARNTGLKIAKGEIIGFTDSDCIPNTDWISKAVVIFAII
jgi:glycosyltransferase involved in cell wall biosynthesis